MMLFELLMIQYQQLRHNLKDNLIKLRSWRECEKLYFTLKRFVHLNKKLIKPWCHQAILGPKYTFGCTNEENDIKLHDENNNLPYKLS